MRRPLIALACAAALLFPAPLLAQSGADAPTGRYDGIAHPEWVRDTAIYEINLRHFTREGTLAAAQRELPRLKRLGIGIVWLMPIHPVGQARTKGTLGSPYAIRDFRGVDPAYGTLDDLKRFTDAAHRLGLRVILDWVGNHSAWDNPLTREHPDWYRRDAAGTPVPPAWFDWDDVVQFDYAQPGLRRYMADSMAYWVREAGVDGFRCDAAGLVPLDFWEDVRAELMAIRPVFMLAEWDSRDHHFRAFDMTYAWPWADAVGRVVRGQEGAMGALRTFYAWDARFWPRNGIRMFWTSNHDQNAWEATEYEKFGPALDAAIALAAASDGMPLIYNGQEAGNRRRLDLFDRNPIEWRDDPQGTLHQRLLAFRRAHPALHARPWGGPVVEVRNDAQDQVLSFTRTRGADSVLAVFNFSAEPRDLTLRAAELRGRWRDQEDGLVVEGTDTARMALPAWGWRLLVRE